jgi:hypothetical protein
VVLVKLQVLWWWVVVALVVGSGSGSGQVAGALMMGCSCSGRGCSGSGQLWWWALVALVVGSCSALIMGCSCWLCHDCVGDAVTLQRTSWQAVSLSKLEQLPTAASARGLQPQRSKWWIMVGSWDGSVADIEVHLFMAWMEELVSVLLFFCSKQVVCKWVSVT